MGRVGISTPVAFGRRKIRAAAWSLRLVVNDVVPVIPPKEMERRPFLAAVRRRARSAKVRQKYEHAWVLMDRDTMAQDNAEAFYRYLRRHQPNVNAWFALAKTSRDWSRLKAAGFRLLEYGSIDLRHRVASCRLSGVFTG